MQTLAGLPTNMPVARVEFDYDYMSRRVGKTVYEWGSNDWQEVSAITFLYDAWNLISEQTHKQTSAETNFFTFGLDLSGTLQGAGGIGGLVSAMLGTNAVCYTYDGNGNVSELINCAGGKIDAHYEYSPFGETIVATGELAKSNPFRFSTKYADDETSLVYYGYRFYSPTLGRWLSRDPLMDAELYPRNYNLYHFVWNSPIMFVDPQGECPAVLVAVGAWELGEWIIVSCLAAYCTYVATDIAVDTYQTYRLECDKCVPDALVPVTRTRERTKRERRPCPPCPSPPPPEIDTDHPHWPCPGAHWHYYEYHQNPETCECFGPYRKFGGCL
jgi:RHS repeat-associated protein